MAYFASCDHHIAMQRYGDITLPSEGHEYVTHERAEADFGRGKGESLRSCIVSGLGGRLCLSGLDHHSVALHIDSHRG